MRRLLIILLVCVILLSSAGVGAFYLNDYWINRYNELIERQSGIYDLNPNLVWSLIYEETYFRTSVIGEDKEVGLMQVTPTVAREWAKETGLKELEKQTAENVQELLSEPERNIQVGSWYLQKVRANYRDYKAEKAMMLAAYNAGASRVEEWTKDVSEVSKLTEEEFINRIGISTTKAYVSSILKRYRENLVKLRRVDPEKQKQKGFRKPTD